jgi:hypothetical protein
MSDHLNIFLVPSEPDFFPSEQALDSFYSRLRRERLADVLGDVIGTGERLTEGGASHIRLDIPKEAVVWSNKQGGFRVSCPDCAEPLVREFGDGLNAWRSGKSSRMVECNACGACTPLEGLRFRPHAALGRVAIAIRNVGGCTLTPLCREIAENLLGEGFSVVMSRG